MAGFLKANDQFGKKTAVLLNFEVMRKNLLENAVVEEIVTRVNKLTLETKPKWGTMNTTEMLAHCNLINQKMLESQPPFKKTTPVQFISKYLFLYLIPRFPHNLKIPEANVTKGKVAQEKFEAEKARFISLMQMFPKQKSRPVSHPAFGIMNDEAIGKLTWMHMDHHLRQFGV